MQTVHAAATLDTSTTQTVVTATAVMIPAELAQDGAPATVKLAEPDQP